MKVIRSSNPKFFQKQMANQDPGVDPIISHYVNIALGCSGQGDQAWTNNEAQAWGAADGEGPETAGSCGE